MTKQQLHNRILNNVEMFNTLKMSSKMTDKEMSTLTKHIVTHIMEDMKICNIKLVTVEHLSSISWTDKNFREILVKITIQFGWCSIYETVGTFTTL